MQRIMSQMDEYRTSFNADKPNTHTKDMPSILFRCWTIIGRICLPLAVIALRLPIHKHPPHIAFDWLSVGNIISYSFWLSIKDRTVIIDVSANLPIYTYRFFLPCSFQLLFAIVVAYIVVFDYLHLEINAYIHRFTLLFITFNGLRNISKLSTNVGSFVLLSFFPFNFFFQIRFSLSLVRSLFFSQPFRFSPRSVCKM